MTVVWQFSKIDRADKWTISSIKWIKESWVHTFMLADPKLFSLCIFKYMCSCNIVDPTDHSFSANNNNYHSLAVNPVLGIMVDVL